MAIVSTHNQAMTSAAALAACAASVPSDAALDSIGPLVCRFFERSAGRWMSQRRYYTLNVHEPQEVESVIDIDFLEADHPDLNALAAAHGLPVGTLRAGTNIRWESRYLTATRKPATGFTTIGVGDGDWIYRDRGFSSPEPVTAAVNFVNPDTMRLVTTYGHSVFEEEIKLVGDKYRTRQTIATRAGEEVLIGQYLETRIADS
jgi:CpeS-like protein